MSRIELTKSQLELLKRQVAGEVNPFFLTEQESDDLGVLLDKMDELEEELEPSDEEINGHLDAWFLRKYEEQGGDYE